MFSRYKSGGSGPKDPSLPQALGPQGQDAVALAGVEASDLRTHGFPGPLFGWPDGALSWGQHAISYMGWACWEAGMGRDTGRCRTLHARLVLSMVTCQVASRLYPESLYGVPALCQGRLGRTPRLVEGGMAETALGARLGWLAG